MENIKKSNLLLLESCAKKYSYGVPKIIAFSINKIATINITTDKTIRKFFLCWNF